MAKYDLDPLLDSSSPTQVNKGGGGIKYDLDSPTPTPTSTTPAPSKPSSPKPYTPSLTKMAGNIIPEATGMGTSALKTLSDYKSIPGKLLSFGINAIEGLGAATVHYVSPEGQEDIASTFDHPVDFAIAQENKVAHYVEKKPLHSFAIVAGPAIAGKAIKAVMGGAATESEVAAAANRIIKSKVEDLPKVTDALKNIKVKDLSSYTDLHKTLNASIDFHSRAQDDFLRFLDWDHQTMSMKRIPLSQFDETHNLALSGTQTVNHVKSALSNLHDFYSKTKDVDGISKIESLMASAQDQGLTRLEVNDIARMYGREFDSFYKSGSPIESVEGILNKNTRIGVKDAVKRHMTEPQKAAFKQRDSLISNMMTTRRLAQKGMDGVNNLLGSAKVLPPTSPLGKLASKIATTIHDNIILHVKELIGNKRITTVNWLERQERMQKDLKIISRAQDYMERSKFEGEEKIMNEFKLLEPPAMRMPPIRPTGIGNTERKALTYQNDTIEQKKYNDVY